MDPMELGKKISRTKLIRICISLFLPTVLMFGLLLLMYFLLIGSLNSIFEKPIVIVDYEVSEFDPSTNKTTTRFVKMNKNLKNNEYISFKNKYSGLRVTITRLGGKEYQCRGECFCTSRRSSIALSRGLFVVLSAFSVVMAMKISNDMFLDQCIDEYSSECDEHMIFAETSNCDEMTLEGITQKILAEYKLNTRYKCIGKCLRRPHHQMIGEDFTRRCAETYGDCESIVSEREIIYTMVTGDEKHEFFHTSPEQQFLIEVLLEVCNDKTRLSVQDEDDKGLTGACLWRARELREAQILQVPEGVVVRNEKDIAMRLKHVYLKDGYSCCVATIPGESSNKVSWKTIHDNIHCQRISD